MSDFEKELEMMSQEMGDEPEVALPSLEEQKAIAAELKNLRQKVNSHQKYSINTSASFMRKRIRRFTNIK